MNKKRTAKAVLAAFTLSIALPTAAFAATDIDGHWAEDVLVKWEQKGLIGGYGDGTLRPDRTITRAEFVTLVNGVAGFKVAGQNVSFPDVNANDWYAEQVAIAVNAAYVGGYPNGTFGPNDYVTKAQAASMIARLTNLTPDKTPAAQFADANDIPEWAIGVIGAVAKAGYMLGDENNNFNAQKPMTRAEVVTALDHAFSDMKTLEASLSETNGSVMKGSTKAIRVTTVKDATVKALSTNEAVATVAVSGHTITVTGVEKGNATIAITVSAPGYADAKLVYSVHVTAAVSGGGFGGGFAPVDNSIKTDVKVPVNAGDYTAGDTIVIETDFVQPGVANAIDAQTDFSDVPDTLTVDTITLPAGSTFEATIEGTRHTFEINDTGLSVEAVENQSTYSLTVGQIYGALEEGTAKTALENSGLDGETELIKCTVTGDALQWEINGITSEAEQRVIFELLEITLKTK